MFIQEVSEDAARYAAGTQAVQVIIGHLAIDQHKSPGLQLPGQCGEAEFGGVVGAAEHGLAKKQLAHRQAIQATYQFALVPDLDGMRVATLVQLQICLLDASVIQVPSA